MNAKTLLTTVLAAMLATVAVAADVTVGVSNVVSRQRYPWNGLVDIDCEIYCGDPATNINLYLSAKDNAANRSLSVRRVRLEGATAFTNALEVKAGKHRIVWDAGTDAPNVVSGDVTIDVQALVGIVGTAHLVDLSGGAASVELPLGKGGVYQFFVSDKPSWITGISLAIMTGHGVINLGGGNHTIMIDEGGTATLTLSASVNTTDLTRTWRCVVSGESCTHTIVVAQQAPARTPAAAFCLDTRSTLFTAVGAREMIAYSPRWNLAESCAVSADGVNLKTASEEGRVEWSPAVTGLHRLAHSARGETLTAQFTALGDDVAQHAGTFSASETWGCDRVHLVTADVTVPPGKTLTIASGSVVKFMPGVKLDAFGACNAKGVTFTHAYDDAFGGDFLHDGAATAPKTDDYQVRFVDLEVDQKTTFRYLSNPPKFVFVTVSNVVSRQRYPWNGLVDIDCEIACSDPATNINLYLSAKDNAANRSLSVRHVWLESDATHTNALEVKAGKHRIVWDAGTDAPNVVSGDVTIDVQALVGTGNYLVIDLSGGPDAASYPVSYLGAEPQGGWTDEYKTDKLVLRMIQPWTFTMGSPAGEVGRSSYEDQHTVSLTKPFYMGVFEVTQRQWEQVMGTKPSFFSNATYYQTRPVEQVSYNQIRGSSLGAKWPSSGEVDATSFIGKIRIKTGLDEFDLPTEAQWEYACRAGTTTALNSGKNLTGTSSDANMNEVGRYWYNGGSSYSSSCAPTYGTAAVGSYKPNEWGLYDMHGNVWEWCLDWHNEGNLPDATDPVGASSGSDRVSRGGSWSSDANYCRSAYRSGYYVYPSNYDIILGFRLSRTLP